MPAEVEFDTQSDADYVVALQFTANSAPLDLTGSDLLMKIRRTPADSDVFAELKASALAADGVSGIAIVDAANGKIVVTISRSILGRMPAGTYVNDLLWLRPDGLRPALWNGTQNHSIGVSR